MELEVEEALEEEAEEEGKVSRGVTIQIWFLFRTTNWLLALKLGGLIVSSAIVDTFFQGRFSKGPR